MNPNPGLTGAISSEFFRRAIRVLILSGVVVLNAPLYCWADSRLSPGATPSLSSFPQKLSPAAYFPTLIFVILLVGVGAMFFWFVRVFTPDLAPSQTNPDNPPDPSMTPAERVRKMVVFCYVFMLLTLGVAISPTIFLMALPQYVVMAIYNYMPNSPVALVVGCVHDTRPENSHWEIVCQSSDPYISEWVLSIGGLVLNVGPATLPPANASSPPSPIAVDSGAIDGGFQTVANSITERKGSIDAGPASPNASASPESETVSGAGEKNSDEHKPGKTNEPYPPWTPDFNLFSGYWNFPPTVIHGGITVPLYFIIIALVGASISLTRKVPEYQKHFLDQNKDFDAAAMREQLVLQILQFLSAPFLAITSYILVTPAGPSTSIPLAFIAGYSSETVLRLITSAIENVAASSKK